LYITSKIKSDYGNNFFKPEFEQIYSKIVYKAFVNFLSKIVFSYEILYDLFLFIDSYLYPALLIQTIYCEYKINIYRLIKYEINYCTYKHFPSFFEQLLKQIKCSQEHVIISISCDKRIK